MATYTVHVPELSTGDPIRDGERIVFVRDGFSYLALFVPYVWLLVNRLWIAFFVYLIVSVAVGYFVWEPLSAVCLFALNIVLAFEGDTILGIDAASASRITGTFIADSPTYAPGVRLPMSKLSA